jgi:hypothetical protein
MEQIIECSTCGYPLLPEERAGLVEIDGKMCKPVADHSERDLDMVTAPPQPQPLTDEEIFSMLKNIDPETKRLSPGMKALVQEIEAAINARRNK